MNNHYYTENPDIKHEIKNWEAVLLGNGVHFNTDNGVFSKQRVDFGSQVLLNTAEAQADQWTAGNILDLGCGYGPIGIALALAHPTRQIEMVDVNQLALSLAKENAKLNQCDNVSVHISDGLDSVLTTDFAVIMTNPPIRAGKTVVHRFLTDSFNHLKTHGMLYVVIQKKQGAPSASEKMKEVFGNVATIKKDKGYYILKSIKK